MLPAGPGLAKAVTRQAPPRTLDCQLWTISFDFHYSADPSLLGLERLVLVVREVEPHPAIVWYFFERPGEQRRCPMTPEDFRLLALSFPETAESAHMDHPDFRVAGKIFATLGYPEEGWAMVKLTPMEQEMFVKAQPTVFVPVKGAWGRRGCTSVRLRPARKYTLRRALLAAWRLAAPQLFEKPPGGNGRADHGPTRQGKFTSRA